MGFCSSLLRSFRGSVTKIRDWATARVERNIFQGCAIIDLEFGVVRVTYQVKVAGPDREGQVKRPGKGTDGSGTAEEAQCDWGQGPNRALSWVIQE